MEFREKIRAFLGNSLTALGIETLQVNLGYRCNLACRHCHLQAGPRRTEMMTLETVKEVLRVIEKHEIPTLDITGGSPELNPHFRYLVEKARDFGARVMVRTNLTTFFEEGLKDLPHFFKANGVEVIASLPCYQKENVDRVRGKGVFRKIFQALKILNELGYGEEGSDLKLHLVFNPQGPSLPPPQCSLEKTYKEELKKRYGITFNRLYTITNMPLGRFGETLKKTGSLEEYKRVLSSAFNPDTLDGLMCRHLISVGWDGRLYDCDFNQALGLSLLKRYPRHIRDFDFAVLSRREIAVGEHCFGCTAGPGSSCKGVLISS